MDGLCVGLMQMLYVNGLYVGLIRMVYTMPYADGVQRTELMPVEIKQLRYSRSN